MKRLSLKRFLVLCVVTGTLVGLVVNWYLRSDRQFDVIQTLRNGEHAIVFFDQMVEWDAVNSKYESFHEGRFDDVPPKGLRGFLVRWFHRDFIYQPRVLVFFSTPPDDIRESIADPTTIKQLVVTDDIKMWQNEFDELIVISLQDYCSAR